MESLRGRSVLRAVDEAHLDLVEHAVDEGTAAGVAEVLGDLDDLGFQCDARTLVLSRARRALEIGCDGVVSSGLEVHARRVL